MVAAQNYEKNVVTYTMIPIKTILLEHASPQPGQHAVDVACGTGVVARQTAPRVGAAGTVVGVDINPTMLARQFSLGDAGELRALLESAGLADVTIVARSYTVRLPRNRQLIAQTLAGLRTVLPELASFSEEERCAVAEAVELEIGPAGQA